MKKSTKILMYGIGIFLILSTVVLGALLYNVYQSEGMTICSDRVGCGNSSSLEPVTYDHYCSDEEKNKDLECGDYLEPVIGSDGGVYSNPCYACASEEVDAWNYESELN
ncbi:hypothetical protein CL619_03885 [archaeon]|nr:hypothetical protein [archaeon]|tara:strand:+ start:428 stop:754 length:327 start_codon:yes stop_codon:yes gene_type:complete